MDLLRQMQSADLTVNTATYTHVIKACTNAGEFGEAESLMDEMRDAGIHVKSGTMLMVKSQRDRRRGQASRREFGNGNPTASYDRTRGEPTAGFQDEPAFVAREDVGFATTTRESSTLGENIMAVAGRATGDAWGQRSWGVDGGATERQTARERTSRRTVASPPPPPPRVSTKAFLRGVGEHVKSQRWSQIVVELDEAIADPNRKVSKRMYEGCIAGLSVGGRWEDAIGVLEKLQAAGLTPDSRCVTAAIRACARSRPPRWGMAVSLLQGLEEPEVWAYVATLSALAKAGQYKRSLSLLEEMSSAGVEPNL